MRIERILCPTDLTPDSKAALRYAVALAQAYDAELIQMYCEDSSDNTGTLSGKPVDLLDAGLREHAKQRDPKALGWRSIVVGCDDPGDCITREASRHKADLIIMRSRRRPHRAALLGSVAESVSRTAPCPVLVMHADERDWIQGNGNGKQIGLKSLLVAYDFSDHSELALRLGLSVAQEYQAELHLLHVLPPFTLDEPEISWYPLGKEGIYHKAARRLQKAVPDEAHLWCKIKNVICEGQPYREIIHYAQRNEIDLVCLGAQGAGFGLMTLFGSNVDRVLRQAPCPVLVARPLRHIRRATSELVERELGSTPESATVVRALRSA